MKVEAPSLAAVAVSVGGPVLTGGLPISEAAPAAISALGSISGFGPKIEGPSFPEVHTGPFTMFNPTEVASIGQLGFVNESPASPDMLTNMFPIFDVSNIRGSERFDLGISQPEPAPLFGPSLLDSQDAVSEAESILAQARGVQVPEISLEGSLPVNQQAEQTVQLIYQDIKPIGIEESFGISLPKIDQGPVINSMVIAPEPRTVFPQPNPFLEATPRLASFVGAEVAESSLSRPANALTTTEDQPKAGSVSSLPTTDQEEFVDQLVEEVKLVDKPEDGEQIIQGNAIDETTILHAVDKPVAQTREAAIVSAAAKLEAKLKAEGKEGPLEGREIAKLIKNPKAAIYRGGELNEIDPKNSTPDGGWVENLEDLTTRSFDSLEELREQAGKIVSGAPPVVEGEGELLVTDQNVATSLKYAPTAIHPASIVVKRVRKMGKRVEKVPREKKPAQIVEFGENSRKTDEGTIEDLGLAEVFPISPQLKLGLAQTM